MPGNFFDQFDAPAVPSGSFTIGTPDPNHALSADRTRQQMAQDAATEADRRRRAAADAVKAQADAAKAVRDAQAAAGKKTPQEVQNLQQEAIDKIALARSLQQRSRDGWFTTGFGSGVAGMVSGSPAYDVAQDTETLKNASALQRIMEMSAANGGKNPLTPLSNADFQALSSSLSNLTPQQSDVQFQRNAGRVEDLYRRMYEGTGGQNLDAAVARRMEEQGFVSPAASGGNGQQGGTGGGMGRGGPGGPLARAPNAPQMEIATGRTRTVPDPKGSAIIDAMIRSGASDNQINAALAAVGSGRIIPEQAAAVRQYLKQNPGYKGSFGDATKQEDQTFWNRAAASPWGVAAGAAVDGAVGGMTDEIAAGLGFGDMADLNAKKQAAFGAHPYAAFAGQAAGTIGTMAGIGAIGRGVGVTGRFAAPQLIGDMAFGAASGAGQSNDNRLIGAALGVGGGFVRNAVGNGAASAAGALARTGPGTAFTNGARRMFGAKRLPETGPLPGPDRMIFDGINKAGAGDVSAALSEAQRLGIPMGLVDTAPNLRELGGAVVRRSPTASRVAEDALIPRNRGQIDRFGSAVTRDLGPVGNIPQMSADLTAQARTAAAPLYEKAYGNAVPSTPEMEAVLGTPFGRQALGRAKTIAANERRSPAELGFGLDAEGNTVLNARPNDLIARHLGARTELDSAQKAYRAARSDPSASIDAARTRLTAARDALRESDRTLAAAPDPGQAANVPAYTTQTLDYVKRGMDDILEAQRNPITGKLVLDEAGRAQNGVRSQLLGEVDRLNPDFGAARRAYQGPAASRDALARGQDAFGLSPDELAMQVGTQSPEHLAQMQLGYRSALMDRANSVRDVSNPFEATLGSPAARARMETLYPGNPGTSQLMRQRDIEQHLQRTSNAILGNSKTAGRQIADEAFLTSPMMEGALHAGAALATHGASIPGTAARLAGVGMKSRMALGMGKRAEARAEAMAPTLFNTNPAAALSQMDAYAAQQQAWEELVRRTTPKRTIGMFGRGAGSQAAVAPLNYFPTP